jgi:hypothetical protein
MQFNSLITQAWAAGKSFSLREALPHGNHLKDQYNSHAKPKGLLIRTSKRRAN